MNNLGIYIHIPFCVKKCHYCSFISYCVQDEIWIKKYIGSLIKEIQLESNQFADRVVDTIFFGGGTPSYIDAYFIEQVLGTIKESFKLSDAVEISIEGNPNSLTKDKLQRYKEVGINRISIGLQARQNKLLQQIGRSHTLKDYKRAVRDARGVGFTNINTDVMMGLPNQSMRHLMLTIKLATKMSTHISAYSLILEEGTSLCEMVKNQQVKLPDESKTVNMYNRAVKYLGKRGFHRYEVSNFAKTGYECLHNLHCWQYHDYIGFGVASSSKIGELRFARTDTLKEYCELVDKNQSTRVGLEVLAKDDMLEEYIMLNLRTVNGLNLDYVMDKFGYDLITQKQKEIEKYKSLGLVGLDKNILYLTKKGFYVMNTILVDLLPNI